MKRLLGWCCLLVWGVCTSAQPMQLTAMRVSSMLASTRVVFDSNQMPTYHWFVLKNPWRLVIDLKDTRLKAKPLRLPKGVRLLKQLRSGQHGDHLRLVFLLDKSVSVESFVLPPVSTNRYRLVFDLAPHQSIPPSNLQIPTPHEPLLSARTAPTKYRKIIVVVDPGHGGKDPGATGLWGTREKDVALSIGRKLQQQLNQTPGFKAYLTRHRDVFITLRHRLSLARKYHADMFVSIHADAFNRRSARGASVYALSEHGATSEAARWLADSENKSELIGGVSLDDKGNVLRSVLLDLSQTATTTASVAVAKRVLQQLRKITRLHRTRVDQAAFVVLKSPDIPSILVETGFLSNPHEEERLRDTNHQTLLARALVRGMKQYFTLHPPRHTYFARLHQASQ